MISELRYSSGDTLTKYTYTGQYSYASEFGLMFYNARWYDPYLNHFTQPNSIVPDPSDSQDLNRYSYARNNPLRYTDPTGHMVADDDDGGCFICNAPPLPTSLGNAGGGENNNGCVICDLIYSANDVLQTLYGGHEYGVGASPVCLPLPWINCTESETDLYLAGNQFLGQLPWQPVQPSSRRNVFPEKFGNTNLLGRWFPGSGAIYTTFDNNKITNIALDTHIFYPGYVDRTSYVGAFGITYVETYGEGYNDGFELGDYTVPGWFIDQANNADGPIAFKGLNLQLILYTTWVETRQALTHTQQR